MGPPTQRIVLWSLYPFATRLYKSNMQLTKESLQRRSVPVPLYTGWECQQTPMELKRHAQIVTTMPPPRLPHPPSPVGLKFETL